jgi:hypothetical protein
VSRMKYPVSQKFKRDSRIQRNTKPKDHYNELDGNKNIKGSHSIDEAEKAQHKRAF